MVWKVNPLGGKTINRRAGCGKTASPVRREGEPKPIGSPYPYPGLCQQTAGPLGPLKTPVFSGMSSGHVWRCVCHGVLASRARECSGSGAVGNVPAPREIQCPGCGLSGNLKRPRVEPKPEHCRARLGAPMRARCQRGESPRHGVCCGPVKLKVTASPRGGVGSNRRQTAGP